MFLLGLLLSTCFLPAITGASIPTQWPILSIVAIVCLWRRATPTPNLPYYLGLGFLAWATLGLLWTRSPYDGIFALWQFICLASGFTLGAITPNPLNLYRGLAVGLGISSIIAIFQWLGYSPVITLSGNISGLFYNRTVLGASAGLMILILIENSLWLYIPALIPSLLLSGSRGGALILALGLTYRFTHWSVSTAVLIIAVFALSIHPDSSDTLRLQIWGAAIRGLTLFGWGPGSFYEVVLFLSKSQFTVPEFTHNDYLQLWFEYGIFSLAIYAIFACAFIWRRTSSLFAFAILAGFYFPLHVPLVGFLGCFLAGHSLRGFSLDGIILRRCRPDLLPRDDEQGLEASSIRRGLVPIQQRT